MNCHTCEQTPCTCHRSLNGQTWLIQHCLTQGCDAAIRVRTGQQDAVPVCKWCMNNTNYYAMTRQKLQKVRGL